MISIFSERGMIGRMVAISASLFAIISSDFGIQTALGNGLAFGLPVDCKIGETCFIQNYFDVDPGSEARDFQCGAATYNDHKGVDFSVPSFAQMNSGFDVLAAAPGMVKRVRDGLPDRLLTNENRAEIGNQECGNGVIIDHGNGWVTQYCHLRQGSVVVAPDQSVVAGSVLGKIGNSGLAEFPHVHFGVRKDGTPVDPFTGLTATGSCGSGKASTLWNDMAARAVHPPRSELLDLNFAPAAVAPTDAVAMTKAPDGPRADWPAIVVYSSASNLKAGDVQILTLTDPAGRIDTNKAEPLERAKASYVMYTGHRRSQSGWQSGTYSGRYRVIRDGEVIIDTSINQELAAGN
ncbi:MAG: M23 family metallopeptidase [Geminicoccaceae bacterium]